MIKVNLLPATRKRRRGTRRESPAQREIRQGVFFILFALVGSGYAWWDLAEQETRRMETKAGLMAELSMLLEQVKEVEDYERNKITFEQKIKIIEELKKKQEGPVHLLDQISRGLPDRVWLTHLSEKQGQVEVEGKTLTNNDLVDFIKNLKKTGHFVDVSLIESRELQEVGVSYYIFKIKGEVR